MRIPRKNLQLVGGVPMVLRAVQAGFWPLVVSTDDDEIAQTVERAGYKGCVIWRRCGPDGPMSDVVLDALEQLRARGLEYDTVTLLQPSSPLRTRWRPRAPYSPRNPRRSPFTS